ncbi:uncharacterized protein Z518_00559 [Rhinocladiella mackenziei CBS 650.93]|uniref:Rhinocladiella mackenziei CBS 650.93 unplaced genomic scaffold supercont1.1, whole genome shotgun sequence n=1 Tax=Rhinocladiella mackenziei CBS 650.93 TaxID=1442369 RepID=A0A0D2ITR5_9EURO|nr:uncharacterized protein Z518_00559 [Rhinocladiella mackenziei CBS 650.93]KIX09479.1 hypothetical protein Z518_00559 [Rhinocladiella mackenziei CBS 650.93]
MAPRKACVILFPKSILHVDWGRRFDDEEITADVPLPGNDSSVMATTKESGAQSSASLSVSDQEQAIVYLLDQSIESILHDILLDIHQEEKIARMQTAVVEVEQRAEKLGKKVTTDPQDGENADDEPVETNAAVLKSGQVQLKGNPMKTVKHIRCPNCRLRRLQYPRVGFNSRPVPDPTEQYCKTEPMIILDKHDVHGQRKKGVKVKGQAKGKNKKKNEPASPTSENSDPLTPSSSVPTESFEFKEIDYPAAKCPNRESHLGDHWKSVNVFATHLNGSCYLKKDRAAGREANAKIGGTPRDSRANSPKASSNGVKRKAEDENTGGTKKKQKTGDVKKNAKQGVSGPSKLRETNNVDDQGGDSPLKEANGDTIQVTPTKATRDASSEPTLKLKLKTGPGDGTARKKPSKTGKKAS